MRCIPLLVAAPAPQTFSTWLMVLATLLAALAPFAMDDVTCPQLATPAIDLAKRQVRSMPHVERMRRPYQSPAGLSVTVPIQSWHASSYPEAKEENVRVTDTSILFRPTACTLARCDADSQWEGACVSRSKP